MKKLMWIPVLAILLLTAACSDDDNPALPAGCAASPPVNMQAQVTSVGCDSVTCTASFTVSSLAALRRTNWSFPGGSPAESGNFNGTVSWPRRTFPFSQDWTLSGCTCPQADDIDGASCRSTNGRVTFTAAD